MTAPAGPLTLEDLERRQANRVQIGCADDATQDCGRALDALRSVMAERDALQATGQRLIEAGARAVIERDEAREQVRSLTEANETLHGWSKGLEERCRSLTVERDAARAEVRRMSAVVEQSDAVSAASFARAKAAESRLSRAREALDSAEGVCGICARKLAALRAALSEPPAGS